MRWRIHLEVELPVLDLSKCLIDKLIQVYTSQHQPVLVLLELISKLGKESLWENKEGGVMFECQPNANRMPTETPQHSIRSKAYPNVLFLPSCPSHSITSNSSRPLPSVLTCCCVHLGDALSVAVHDRLEEPGTLAQVTHTLHPVRSKGRV